MKQQMTVGDYHMLNTYRKELEIFYSQMRKSLTVVKRYAIVYEINSLRKHLGMNKF